MKPGRRPTISAFLLAAIGMLPLASLGSVEAEEINVLFMGNSFTYRHDLPSLVKQVFEEGQADLTVNVERIVYGGQDLFRHHDLYFSKKAPRGSRSTRWLKTNPKVRVWAKIQTAVTQKSSLRTALKRFFRKLLMML